jgi:hypothetical protein
VNSTSGDKHGQKSIWQRFRDVSLAAIGPGIRQHRIARDTAELSASIASVPVLKLKLTRNQARDSCPIGSLEIPISPREILALIVAKTVPLHLEVA